MRGPLVVRRVLIPVLAGLMVLLVGWTVAAPASGASAGRPGQNDTTTVDPGETTSTVTPPTATPPVPTVANESTQSVEKKGEIDDPAQKELRWIIIGLLGLAVVILILTIWFWRATRPARRPQPETPPSDAPAAGRAPDDDQRVPVVAAAASVGAPMPTDSVRIAAALTGGAPRSPCPDLGRRACECRHRPTPGEEPGDRQVG